MRRLMVLCVCGERIQVPRSALGRSGLCPACGRVISITASSATPAKGPVPAKPASVQNASPFQSTSPFQGGGSSFGASWNSGNGSAAPADAKRRFAEAVDLYFSRRYAEALSIFETLAEEFPDNADISSGKSMCMAALQNRQQLALEHQQDRNANLPVPMDGRGTGPAPRFSPPTETIPDNVVEDTLKHVLVEKMLNGTDDRIQLRAAELAIRVFGFGKKKPGDDDKAHDDDVHDEADADTREPNEDEPQEESTPSDDEHS